MESISSGSRKLEEYCNGGENAHRVFSSREIRAK